MAHAVSSPVRDPTRYIANPLYDWVFFIASPLIGLGLILLLERTPVFTEVDLLGGGKAPLIMFLTAAWAYSHLFAVFLRSHVNQKIFQRFRLRFTIVPLLLILGCWLSQPIFTLAALTGFFWDFYHTAMQSFGLGRIYDAKAGNDPTVGRTLDKWLNLLIYIGPVAFGLSYQTNLQQVQGFMQVAGFDPAWLADLMLKPEYHDGLRNGILAVAMLFVPLYVMRYFTLVGKGYRISRAKIALLLCTATASIVAWTQLQPIHAFFVIEFFHGLQYFAIVWKTERTTINSLFGQRAVIALPLYVLSMLALGCTYLFFGNASSSYQFQFSASLFIVVSLMHFWYDGFIWSVRAKDV